MTTTYFSPEEALRIADDYLAANWGAMVEDIDALVRIPSFREADKAAPGAPWGPGPRAGLTAGLELAQRMGFSATDLDGYLGYADLPGESATQVGIIGHMDVVPAGPGWTFPPYQVSRKDGYLVGRGVVDDKGPSLMALHAVNALRQQGVLPYTVRFIFGAGEECGMDDVPYYQAVQPDPAFLFTPDADFPVCNGEKGHYEGTFVSAPVADGCIAEFEGGLAGNAVAGQAQCVVRGEVGDFPAADGITVSQEAPGLVRLFAQGRSAHASTPARGVNAIGMMVDYLLANAPLAAGERQFLEFEQQLMASTDGSTLGVASWGEGLKDLTHVGGVITLANGVLTQSIDIRYPETVTGEWLTEQLVAAAAPFDVQLQDAHFQVPFLVDAQSPEIQALLGAYVQVTGREAEPFTMGGATYARVFSNAASFGPLFPFGEHPAWVGRMHGPDEGVSEETLREAFRIYVVALANLMRLEL
ncbi:MAG: Sapep family Mn(2+)-dependent dipeptidase [Coriobacteriia bacterium]|nr:Sapep family Mn(2+)-dependent dipeptidase [Coriobacteriia bacterium]